MRYRPSTGEIRNVWKIETKKIINKEPSGIWTKESQQKIKTDGWRGSESYSSSQVPRETWPLSGSEKDKLKRSFSMKYIGHISYVSSPSPSVSAHRVG